MALLEHYLQMEMEALIEQGARFRAIGRINTLPESALAWVRKVERATAHLDTLNLTVALSYGGRSEIVDAVRRLAEDVKRVVVKPDQIDEDLLEGYLSTHGLPDPDLLIRTSRSEEHTSELQSRLHLVCRLLLEKKKNRTVKRCCSPIRSQEKDAT